MKPRFDAACETCEYRALDPGILPCSACLDKTGAVAKHWKRANGGTCFMCKHPIRSHDPEDGTCDHIANNPAEGCCKCGRTPQPAKAVDGA